MKILLVEDSVRHRRAGQKVLAELGHEVVALHSYHEARKVMERDKFYVALLDLLMPAETDTLGPEAIATHAGVPLGVGFPLIIEAVRQGVPLVAVATDTNHHNHPMSAIVDWFKGQPIHIGNSKVIICHSPIINETKDWVAVLKQLL